MIQVLTRNWWAVLIRGIAAIVFGILAFTIPGATLFALVILFGAYALIDGIFAIVAAVRAAEAHTRWMPLAVEGIIGILIAAITFFYPGITALTLVYVIAAWAILTGIFELFAAFQLRQVVTNEVWLIIAGILSIVFGVIIAIRPGGGALAIVWLIGFYAIVFGIALVALAFRLRSHTV
ncbi:MAG: HdeD family acid-resistance protein [Vulcanimicrobiaceae bacterium]